MTDAWKTMDAVPDDRPFLALRWNRDWLKGSGEWKIMGVFARRSPPDHDPNVFAVSADGQYWLRDTVWNNGARELDAWRWMEIPHFPENPD